MWRWSHSMLRNASFNDQARARPALIRIPIQSSDAVWPIRNHTLVIIYYTRSSNLVAFNCKLYLGFVNNHLNQTIPTTSQCVSRLISTCANEKRPVSNSRIYPIDISY